MVDTLSLKRVAVTGGAGYLGALTCRHLETKGHRVRSLDIKRPADPASPDSRQVDLGDFEGIKAALEGIDLVIHLGADLSEDEWAPILNANIVGSYNVFESARQLGIPRVIYASSHHVSGMYRTTEVVDTKAPTRPDSLYGLSKTFAEQLAQYYWDKYGIESAGLRIGSARPQPEQAREHFTWLSEPDYCRLIDACIATIRIEHTLVWGMSDNHGAWWSNVLASHLGYAPQDGAAPLDRPASTAEAASLAYQGGKRALLGLKGKP